MAFLTAEQKKEQGLIHAGFDHAWMIRLLLIRILARNIILRHLMCANFPLVSVPGVLHPLYHVRFKRVSFPEQLVHTLRIRTLDVGQSLQISRLLARLRSQCLQCECHSIHALAFHLNPLLSQLFLYRLLRRRHFLAHSSLRLRASSWVSFWQPWAQSTTGWSFSADASPGAHTDAASLGYTVRLLAMLPPASSPATRSLFCCYVSLRFSEYRLAARALRYGLAMQLTPE